MLAAGSVSGGATLCFNPVNDCIYTYVRSKALTRRDYPAEVQRTAAPLAMGLYTEAVGLSPSPRERVPMRVLDSTSGIVRCSKRPALGETPARSSVSGFAGTLRRGTAVVGIEDRAADFRRFVVEDVARRRAVEDAFIAEAGDSSYHP